MGTTILTNTNQTKLENERGNNFYTSFPVAIILCRD